MEELAGFGESRHLGMALSFQRMPVSMLKRTFNLIKNSWLKYAQVANSDHHYPSPSFRSLQALDSSSKSVGVGRLKGPGRGGMEPRCGENLLEHVGKTMVVVEVWVLKGKI